MLSLDYAAPGRNLAQFIRCDDFVTGIMGPYGSGKSTACVMKILRKAAEQRQGRDGKRHSRWAVIRNSFPELRTTTIKTWHQWVPEYLGSWRAAGPPTHRITEGDLDLEIMFLALDKPEDVRKLGSLELTGAWLNEVREIPRSILDGITGRVGRYPSALMGGCSWRGVIMDTNPPETDSWYYTLAEGPKVEGYRFFKQPSGLAKDAENLAWLDQTEESLQLDPKDPRRQAIGRGYYERIAINKDGDWIKVYVDGDYGFAIDGKPIYPEYRDGLHCVEFELDPNLPIYVGIDFGLTPAALIGQRTFLGQWRWRSELVTEDMGATRFGELLGAELRGRYGAFKIAAITGDPAGDTRAQTDETTPFQIMRSLGVSARPAPTNDFIVRREGVAECLRRLVDTRPGLLIHPECKMARKGMAGGYNYRRLQVSGQERYRDVPDKSIYSHVCEAGQYMLLGGGEGRRVLKGDKPRNSKPWVVPTYDMLA